MRLLVDVVDNGNNWKVNRAFRWENILLTEGNIYLEVVNDFVWKEISNHLLVGSQVFLPKGLLREFTESDIIIPRPEPNTPLEIPKRAAKAVGWDHLIKRLRYETIIQSYVFMIENMRMLEKGYFIHDDNREEQYLEIINTGDEDLISLLESYLEAKDDIIFVDRHHRRHKDFLEEIDETESLEEVKSVTDSYIQTFD